MNIIPIDKNSDNYSLSCMNNCQELANTLKKDCENATTTEDKIAFAKAVVGLYNAGTSAGNLAVSALTATVKANESVIKHSGLI